MTKQEAIVLAKKAILTYNRKGMVADAIFWEEVLMGILEKKYEVNKKIIKK